VPINIKAARDNKRMQFPFVKNESGIYPKRLRRVARDRQSQ
jgi:hypothetical protein